MAKQMQPYDPRTPNMVYRRGAEDGLILGVYLSVMMIFMCQSALGAPMLGLISLLMVLGVPFVLYRFLRRAWVADKGQSPFSVLWLHGIMAFVCGTLIMGAALWIYLRLTNPHFVYNLVSEAAQFYSQIGTDMADKMAATLNQMIERHMLPTVGQLVVQFILLGIFTGSILSILVTAIVRLRRPQQ